ncbi:phosphate ABC transporter permease subunit PstC [candidate division GN15 bacterium]|nr:phosphate ABC transporter permease subunit PstC [candidate division GN15 bacterium]
MNVSTTRIAEWCTEALARLAALCTSLAIVFILVFVAIEALPIVTDSSVREEVTVDQMVFQQDIDPTQEKGWAWQPTSRTPRYSLAPLILGSLKAAFVALLVAVPLGIAAALYTSEFASQRAREFIKPIIELLAGIPSVVLGFFALLVLADFLQSVFGYPFRLNAINAGLMLGFAIVPIIFTISEDSLSAVPHSQRDAALALGATHWQVTWTVVLPAALPGVVSGIVLGFGRAMGETMIVLMASGNAAMVSLDLTDSVRTIAATIASEMAGAVTGSAHYTVLFVLGLVLFAFTFMTNLGSQLILDRLRHRLQGSRV